MVWPLCPLHSGEECEKSSSSPESSALTGLWVLRWPVRAPGSRTWSAHSSSGQGKRTIFILDWFQLGYSCLRHLQPVLKPLLESFPLPTTRHLTASTNSSGRRWSQAEGLNHRAVEGLGSFAAEREASICVTNIVIRLLFSEWEH